MILKLTAHKTSQDVVVVHAGPELAEFMGRFAPARWQPSSKTYWVEAQHLAGLFRLAEIERQTIVDERSKGPAVEKFTGPLPECDHCGQVVARSASPSFCPACGRPWVATVITYRSADMTPRSTCTGCEREQVGAFGYCTACGGAMVRLPVGKRPDHVERPKLGHPLTLDDAIEGNADLTRDHMQRAAGDR